MRRVVTGIDKDGKSVFVSDGEPPRNFKVKSTGQAVFEVWRTYGNPRLPVDDVDPTVEMTSFLPAIGEGGALFRIVRYPGTKAIEKAVKEGADLAAIQKERQAYGAGFVSRREENNPAMHTTDTIDYAVVVSGEVWLELDDGAEVLLKQGDTVVQNGTRHAWYHRSPEPCVLAFCMTGIGARE
ncbi:cupin domain-containing protein [Chloroflexota bacterium]